MFRKSMALLCLSSATLAFKMEKVLGQTASSTALTTSVDLNQGCCCEAMPCLKTCSDPCQHESKEEVDEMKELENQLREALDEVVPEIQDIYLKEKGVLLKKVETKEIVEKLFDDKIGDLVEAVEEKHIVDEIKKEAHLEAFIEAEPEVIKEIAAGDGSKADTGPSTTQDQGAGGLNKTNSGGGVLGQIDYHTLHVIDNGMGVVTDFAQLLVQAMQKKDWANAPKKVSRKDAINIASK